MVYSYFTIEFAKSVNESYEISGSKGNWRLQNRFNDFKMVLRDFLLGVIDR